MRKLIFTTLVSLTAIISCKKEKKDNIVTTPTSTVNPGTTCKVDGTDWSADKSKTYILDGDSIKGLDIYISGDTSLSFNALNIKGTDTSIIEGEIALKTNPIGTYNLSFTGDNYMLLIKKYLPSISSIDIAYLVGYLGYADGGTLTGTFEITAYNKSTKKISGKYNFTQSPGSGAPTLPTLNITNGVFEDISFTN